MCRKEASHHSRAISYQIEKAEPKVYAVCGDWCLDFMFNFEYTMNQRVRGHSELSGVRP